MFIAIIQILCLKYMYIFCIFLSGIFFYFILLRLRIALTVKFTICLNDIIQKITLFMILNS